MKKIKLTCAHAIIKHLIAQKILIDGKKEPLFAGAFGIFGHGNVACLGQALEENKARVKNKIQKIFIGSFIIHEPSILLRFKPSFFHYILTKNHWL